LSRASTTGLLTIAPLVLVVVVLVLGWRYRGRDR
jgi:hypothetical protein